MNAFLWLKQISVPNWVCTPLHLKRFTKKGQKTNKERYKRLAAGFCAKKMMLCALHQKKELNYKRF